MSGYSFTSPVALSRINRIETYIGLHNGIDVAHIAGIIGIKECTARLYVNYLHECLSVKPITLKNGRVLWVSGADPEIAEKEEKALAFRHQVVTTHKPHHVRSMFDCLLFGVPEAMREAV